MSDLKVCRICLRAQCKVYKYDRYQLKAYYEEVMAQKMNDSDGLPNYFCYECATVLHKFHKFKEKCWLGERLLKQIQVSQKGCITYEAVHDVDRGSYSLKSPLQILTVTKRVKTYVIVDKIEVSDSECEPMDTGDEKEVCIEEEVFEDEGTTFDNHYDSETPLEDFKDVVVIDDPVKPIEVSKLNNEEEIKATDFKIEEDEEKSIGSPQTIFVDVKKDVIVLKSEPIKERRKSFSEYGLKKINPRFSKPKFNYPDKDIWKIYTLSEEEAVKEFQLRAETQSYKDAPFKCVDCFKGFSKEDMLKRHKQLRHVESLGQMECRFCHKRFKWDSKLRRHMVEHFTRYKCLLCDIVVCVENTALLHQEWHKDAVKKCHHCGEEFRHRSTYYTHLRTHRSEHVCTLCGMSFVSPSGLHMHKRIKHIDGRVNDEDEDDAPVNTFCEKCDIRFETRTAFEEHLFQSAMHTDGTEEEQDRYGITKKILGKRTQEIILGKRSPARIRAKTKLTQELSDDQLPAKPKKGRRPRHRKCYKKPTTCNQCGKHFETQAACMKHHQEQHPRTSFFSERHICEICGASLAPGSVLMHQNIHSRQKEFPCDTCGKKFHSLAGHKRHLVTHTGEKPFACTLCDKRFTQSNSMKLHYNTFHLKQPYPKRNRRKRKDEFPELLPSEDKSTSEESEGSLPEPEPRVEPATTQDNSESLHYLTLS